MSQPLDFERRVAAWVADEGASTPPVRVLDDILTATGRQRPLPRWLALIKEPPMRVSSRVAVGSPTARLTALVATTILLVVLGAGAVVAGASYLAGPGLLIVDPNDPSAYPTITAAVDAAEDGDTVLVRPGIYPESVTITEDITLRGDGPREEVVIEIPSSGPTFPTEFGPLIFGLMIQDSDAEVSELTVRPVAGADQTLFSPLVVDGGAPRIHEVTTAAGVAAWIMGGSTGTVADSTLDGIVFVNDSGGSTIEGNTIRYHVMVGNPPEARPVVIRENVLAGVSVASLDPNWLGTAGPAIIEGNHLRVPDGEEDTAPSDFLGINLANSQGFEVTANDVAGFTTGIDIRFGSSGVASDNILADNVVGVRIEGGVGTSQVVGNRIDGGGTGIRTVGGSPRLEDNTVEGAEIGVEIGPTSDPTLTGNVLCGNAINLSVAEGVEPVLETNEICEDGLVTTGG
jgi:Periplasmic copper-binding protein (NosD)